MYFIFSIPIIWMLVHNIENNIIPFFENHFKATVSAALSIAS